MNDIDEKLPNPTQQHHVMSLIIPLIPIIDFNVLIAVGGSASLRRGVKYLKQIVKRYYSTITSVKKAFRPAIVVRWNHRTLDIQEVLEGIKPEVLGDCFLSRRHHLADVVCLKIEKRGAGNKQRFSKRKFCYCN